MNKSVLFVHDNWLGLYQDKVYGIQYTNTLITRYSYFGGHVSLLNRGREITAEDLPKYSHLDHPNLRHIYVPNIRSVRGLAQKNEAKTIIETAVEQHDIIIVRLPSSTGAIAMRHAKKINKPVLVEFVSCTFDALWNYDWRGKLLAPFKYYKTKKLMLQTTHSIYVTDKFLQARYPNPGKSIGLSDVELQPIDSEILASRLQKIQTQTSPLKLITVAAIDVAYKNQASVIKAIAALKQKGIYFQYDLIGEGNPEKLRKLIKKLHLQDQVRLIGILPHAEVFKAMTTADIYIQPSKQEGLPRAVIEAMSMAMPVIGADTGGIPELLEPDAIYRKRDPKALVNILSSVNADFQERHARLNFEKAKEFQKAGLDNKRQEFYKIFKEDYGLK